MARKPPHESAAAIDGTLRNRLYKRSRSIRSDLNYVGTFDFRICHVISFVWCFAYLGFFRTAEYFGLSPISPLDNALQLFVTLRVSS